MLLAVQYGANVPDVLTFSFAVTEGCEGEGKSPVRKNLDYVFTTFGTMGVTVVVGTPICFAG